MSEGELDIEPTGDFLDGAEPRDPDDAGADSPFDLLKAKRPKKVKHQGRRGRRVNREDPGGSK